MNTCIYTFTGTGTALSIADQVSLVLGDTDVRLIPRLLADSKDELKADAPNIGFVFPNYFGGIPNAVLTFIRKLNMEDVQYIFAIVPAGGGQGYTLKYLQKELLEKGKQLAYGRYVAGPSNYIVAGYYGLVAKTGDQREKALKTLRGKIKIYAREIQQSRHFVQWSNPFIFAINRLLSSLSSRDVLKDTSAGDKDFSFGGRCTGCGICQKVCQADNIVLTDSKPSFQHKCRRCMACLQYCPHNAVLFKGKELNKPQYVHPDYPAGKMISRIAASCDTGSRV